MAEMRQRWGDEETAAEKVRMRTLQWLGHLARMPDHRIPRSALFGCLEVALGEMEGCDEKGFEGICTA